MTQWIRNWLLIMLIAIQPAAYASNNPAYQALELIQQDKPMAALKILDQELRVHPNNKEAYQSRGLAHFTLGDYARACADYTRVIAMDKRNVAAHQTRAYCWDYLGKGEKAIEDFTAVIKLTPNDDEPYHYRAEQFLKMKKYKEAVADSNESLRLHPNHMRAYYYRAKAYDMLGEKQKAANDREEIAKQLKLEHASK